MTRPRPVGTRGPRLPLRRAQGCAFQAGHRQNHNFRLRSSSVAYGCCERPLVPPATMTDLEPSNAGDGVREPVISSGRTRRPRSALARRSSARYPGCTSRRSPGHVKPDNSSPTGGTRTGTSTIHLVSPLRPRRATSALQKSGLETSRLSRPDTRSTYEISCSIASAVHPMPEQATVRISTWLDSCCAVAQEGGAGPILEWNPETITVFQSPTASRTR